LAFASLNGTLSAGTTAKSGRLVLDDGIDIEPEEELFIGGRDIVEREDEYGVILGILISPGATPCLRAFELESKEEFNF